MRSPHKSAVAWGVSEDTVWKYIRRGYIFGIEVQGNELLLPEICKPYVPTFSVSKDRHIDNTILKALDKHGYLNNVILGVSADRFNERISALLHAGYILKTGCPCEDICASTVGYMSGTAQIKGITVNVSAVKVDAGLSAGPSLSVINI